jgi:hypothetical protein
MTRGLGQRVEQRAAAPAGGRLALQDYFFSVSGFTTQQKVPPSRHFEQLWPISSFVFPWVTVIVPPQCPQSCFEPTVTQ